MIRIRSKYHNFRRCGLPHPKEAREYPGDRFSEQELKILNAEPVLIVEIIPDEPEPASPDDLIAAAEEAIEAGQVTKDGKPLVEAMEEILGYDITAEDRDKAHETLTADS